MIGAPKICIYLKKIWTICSVVTIPDFHCNFGERTLLGDSFKWTNHKSNYSQTKPYMT